MKNEKVTEIFGDFFFQSHQMDDRISRERKTPIFMTNGKKIKNKSILKKRQNTFFHLRHQKKNCEKISIQSLFDLD